jgi:predicted DNA-binding transcriptional regulator YafY
MALQFEPTGDLLSDLSSCIATQTMMSFSYTDKKGESSERVVAPLEIRGAGLYGWSISKNGQGDGGLRFFLLSGIGSHEVIDQNFDKEQFKS